MPTIINKVFPKAAAVIGFILLPVLAIAGCSGDMDPEPTKMPATPKTTETISFEIADLFERYAVSGIVHGSVMMVHEQPSTNSTVLGNIPSSGIDIIPTGKVNKDGDTVWAYINHNETAGWVDMDFLAEQHGSLPEDLILLGQEVLESLKNGQYSQLAHLIDPSSCLRFSPYQSLNTDNRIICPSDIDSYANSGDTLNWGHYDGTGKPIDLTFIEYHQQFVYDQHYQKPSVVGFNSEVSAGNAINNIQEIYPDGIMIEYYFPGFDPQYGGMDWRSLRLVFVTENDQWYLAAIIHGEWTI